MAPDDNDIIEPSKRIVHRGSKVARRQLLPLGKEVNVSQTMKELMEDLRNSAAAFGNATATSDIEQLWVNMQMRYYDLARQVSTYEFNLRQRRDALMKF